MKNELESAGLKVNILQNQPTLLEHLADVQGHRCLVSGDSLPMHLALGTAISVEKVMDAVMAQLDALVVSAR